MKSHFSSQKTLTAATSITTLLAATNAEALIVRFDSSAFAVNDTITTADWNIDGVGLAEATIQTYVNTFLSTGAIDIAANANAFELVTNGGLLEALGSGALVSSALSFNGTLNSVVNSTSLAGANTTTNTTALGFSDGDSALVGFRFNPSGTLELYGWAEVVLSTGGGNGEVKVLGWAYEDSGSAIAVPEPEFAGMGLGLLALGAAGVRRWRHTKPAA